MAAAATAGRVFVIAEAGVNHNGDVGLARALVDLAAEAGADAVKFQTFSTARLVSKRAPTAEYQRRATGGEQSQFSMLSALELSPAAHEALLAHCAERRIEFMSAPHDVESARFLKRLGVRRLKIPSGDVTNLPMLEIVGGLALPVILSTGMADLAEVDAAVAALRRAGLTDLVLLQCVSDYPASPAGMNLRVMDTYQRRFGVPVGLSDHTLGIHIAVAAVGRGAMSSRKHFTLGPRARRPRSPGVSRSGQLRGLIRAIPRRRGRAGRRRQGADAQRAAHSRRRRKSLVAARDLPAGTIVGPDDLVILRPGTGLPPGAMTQVLGRKTARAIQADTPLSEDMLL